MATITALNGQVPVVLLEVVDPSGHRLRRDAARALRALSAAMKAAGYGELQLSAGLSAYRTLAEQRTMILAGLTTMPAGRSQHGEATAADLANLGGFSGPRHRWLTEHGPFYGWSQPTWALINGSLPESWHWEYDPANDRHQEDPMGHVDTISDAAAQAIANKVFLHTLPARGGLPAAPFMVHVLDAHVHARNAAARAGQPAALDAKALAADLADALGDELARDLALELSNRLRA